MFSVENWTSVHNNQMKRFFITNAAFKIMSDEREAGLGYTVNNWQNLYKTKDKGNHQMNGVSSTL